MIKRFLGGILLIIIIFLTFILIRETAQKYLPQKNNIIKNYNFVEI